MDCEKDNEWIAFMALALNIMAMLPQIYHVYKQKDARNLSYIWLITSFLANILWFIFGLKKNIPSLICSASFFMSAFFLLGIMKYIFRR